MDEPERWPSRPIMEQWYSLNIWGEHRLAVKDSLLDNTLWFGAAINYDRPRAAIVRCIHATHRDSLFTRFSAEILKYGLQGKLHSFMTCSVLIPNMYLRGLTEEFTATLTHAFVQESDQRVLPVDIEQGGCFARPCLQKPSCAVDLFAGLGGWAIGQDWAIESTGRHSPLITASIEYNRDTAKASSELFGGTFWDLDPFFAETGAQLNHGHHFINAKVGDRTVQQKLATWNFAVAVASPSCQPWSSASNQHDLSADLGFNFCELNNFLCAMQPCLLALENVKGLLNHPHFGLLVKILEHNGLRLVYQEIQTTRKWLPTERTRLFCIFRRLDWNCPNEKIQMLQKFSIPWNLQTENIHRYLDEDVSDEHLLKPTCQELFNLANPQYLTGASASMNPLKVLDARNVATKNHFGPIMASYRSNASFQESFKKDHKLLADIKCSNGMYLFLHPIKIAALGMLKEVRGKGFEIPDEPTDAFRLLGNMYVPLQSGQAWIKIEHLVNPESAYTCMKEVGKLWKISMIDFSVCRIRHVDHVFSVESKSREDTDDCVPTQKFRKEQVLHLMRESLHAKASVRASFCTRTNCYLGSSS